MADQTRTKATETAKVKEEVKEKKNSTKEFINTSSNPNDSAFMLEELLMRLEFAGIN